MQRKEAQRLSDLLPKVLSDQNLTQRLDETQIGVLWRNLFSETVAGYTTRAQMRNGKLYVSLSSAILRNELMCNKISLIERLNEELGKPLVKDIIFR